MDRPLSPIKLLSMVKVPDWGRGSSSTWRRFGLAFAVEYGYRSKGRPKGNPYIHNFFHRTAVRQTLQQQECTVVISIIDTLHLLVKFFWDLTWEHHANACVLQGVRDMDPGEGAEEGEAIF